MEASGAYSQNRLRAVLLAIFFGPFGILYSSNILAILSALLLLLFLGLYIDSLAFKLAFGLACGIMAYIWPRVRSQINISSTLVNFDNPSIKKGSAIALIILASQFPFLRYAQNYMSINGYSMSPTILKNEKVRVSLLPSLRHKLARGIIVAYQTNQTRGKLLSRVVGLSGDVVELKKGRVYINGNPADDADRLQFLRASGCLDEELEFNNSVSINGLAQIRVPPNHVFLVADNRASSFPDSRLFGAIPTSSILGVVHLNARKRTSSNEADCLPPQ